MTKTYEVCDDELNLITEVDIPLSTIDPQSGPPARIVVNGKMANYYKEHGVYISHE